MRRLTIQDAHTVAVNHGGRLLSRTYHNSDQRLVWKCGNGHTWRARLSNVRAGSWCPACAGNLPLTIHALRRKAREMGLKCLAPAYKNAHAIMWWLCPYGHRFKKNWNKIQLGQRCPVCETYLGEKLCRLIFEACFKSPFPRVSPEWLRGPTGRRLQLDGYCEKLKIAFEHQGGQHDTPIGMFTHEMVAQIKARDRVKRRLCARNGVTLIEVPDVSANFSIEKLRNLLQLTFTKLKLRPAVSALKARIDLRKLNSHRSDDEFVRLKKAAIKRRGCLLSKQYLTANTKYEFRCKLGHTFARKASEVMLANKWCEICCNQRIRPTHRNINIRIQRHGRCLTKKVISARQKLRFECRTCGRRFFATLDYITTRIKNGKGFCSRCLSAGD